MPDHKLPNALPKNAVEIVAFMVLLCPRPNQNCVVRAKGHLSCQWYTQAPLSIQKGSKNQKERERKKKFNLLTIYHSHKMIKRKKKVGKIVLLFLHAHSKNLPFCCQDVGGRILFMVMYLNTHIQPLRFFCITVGIHGREGVEAEQAQTRAMLCIKPMYMFYFLVTFLAMNSTLFMLTLIN